jgi:hypothetical protein
MPIQLTPEERRASKLAATNAESPTNGVGLHLLGRAGPRRAVEPVATCTPSPTQLWERVGEVYEPG